MKLLLCSLRYLCAFTINTGRAIDLTKNALCVLAIFSCTSLISQEKTEHWETYMASYEEGKPGSTTVEWI